MAEALSEFEALDITPLIAAEPADPRDSSRLLVLDRSTGQISHSVFRDIAGILRPGDVLVLNRSRVIKAKLPAAKTTGGKAELLLVRPLDATLRTWDVLARKARQGQELNCAGGASAKCLAQNADGSFTFSFSSPLDETYLQQNAEVPLPQYILKAREDRATAPKDDLSYQTVYAAEPGSIAAPTAGFHFTSELLAKLKTLGVDTQYVTLHIGWGTFKPVRTEDPADHVMLEEECFVSDGTAAAINTAKKRGSRIIAVGTSSMRTLETLSDENGTLRPGQAKAGLFIYPGYEFKVADAFLTNLHVPSSAPLYMTAAFAGREKLFKAYTEAVTKRYRFYSYGDSMLII